MANKITHDAIIYHDSAFPATWRILPRSLHCVIDTQSGYFMEWRPWSGNFGELYITIRKMLESGADSIDVDDDTIDMVFADFKPVKAPREKKPVDSDRITWIGKRIDGKGFWIAFDAEAGKTLIHFTTKPAKKALDLLHAEKWFYRGDLRAWSKKLSVKAYKAAVKFALAMDASIPDDLTIPDLT